MTDDRTVLVTGASSGLGFATALHLARHGWRTFAGVRTASKADRVREAAAGLPLEVVALGRHERRVGRRCVRGGQARWTSS